MLLVLALVPSAAAAQTGVDAISAVRRDARLRIGPFYLTPTLTVENIGIDDNVLLDPETGQPKSDFTATLTPGLRVRMPVARRMLLSSDVSTGLVWYKDFADERSLNPSISGAADIYIGRMTVQGGASFRQSSDRPSLEIDSRSLNREHGFSGAVGYRFRPKLEFGVSGSKSTVRFGEEEIFLGTLLRETLNRTTNEFGAEVRQTLTPKTLVYVSSVVDDINFEFSPERNAGGFRITPGVEFSPTALISGYAEAGYRRLAADEESVPDFSGIIAAVELTHRLRESTSVTVGWNRNLEFSYQLKRPHFTTNRLMASVRRQIAGKFDTRLLFARAYHRYDDIPDTPLDDANTEIIQNYSADVGYRLSRNTRLAFGLLGADRSSTDNPTRTYQRIRWGFNLGYGPR